MMVKIGTHLIKCSSRCKNVKPTQFKIKFLCHCLIETTRYKKIKDDNATLRRLSRGYTSTFGDKKNV